VTSNLDGKVAIVTGAARGIGAACAAELARRGAAVVVADIDGEGASVHASAIEASGGNAIGLEIDVAEEASIVSMIDAAAKTFGGVDILHSNAAATSASVQDRDITEMSVEMWDLTMAVNLRGAFLGAKHSIPRMLERGGGVIVNTSSGAGTLAEGVRLAYGASKAAIDSLTRGIAVQYGKRNIRCVAVAPGITLADEAVAALEGTDWLEVMRRNHLTPYLGVPDDIAQLVAFLVSDDARFITGSVHAIDGGITAPVPYWAQIQE
jgi:NAD(P)-dependent dehydrogenase (short-subunit alcohol dehydrogenase family)